MKPSVDRGTHSRQVGGILVILVLQVDKLISMISIESLAKTANIAENWHLIVNISISYMQII